MLNLVTKRSMKTGQLVSIPLSYVFAAGRAQVSKTSGHGHKLLTVAAAGVLRGLLRHKFGWIATRGWL